METKMRKCSGCGGIYPETAEYFHRDSSKANGLRYECKKCTRKRHIPYRREERIESISKQKAQNYAKLWNEVRIDMGDKHFNTSEFVRNKVAPYVVHYSSALRNSKYLTEHCNGDFSWSGIPVPFTFFIENPPKYKAVGFDSLKNDNMKCNIDIKSFLDADLVNELRLRGFEVKATKTIEL